MYCTNVHYTLFSQREFSPRPADLRNINLTRGMLEMAEKVAENAHEVWAKKKKLELEAIG